MSQSLIIICYIFLQLKTGDYWEKEVPSFTNHRFKEAFRVTRSTFQFIIERLHFLRRQDTVLRYAIVLEKRIAIALYALASSAEYRTIAALFGVGRTTVGELVVDFCKALVEIFETEFINAYPPTQEKLNEVVTGFREVHGFPQVYGAVGK